MLWFTFFILSEKANNDGGSVSGSLAQSVGFCVKVLNLFFSIAVFDKDAYFEVTYGDFVCVDWD